MSTCRDNVLEGCHLESRARAHLQAVELTDLAWTAPCEVLFDDMDGLQNGVAGELMKLPVAARSKVAANVLLCGGECHWLLRMQIACHACGLSCPH